MLIDTHCHINFKDFKDDADEVIKRAYEGGVECVVVGAEKDTSRRALQYAERYENMWAVVGLHPTHIFDWEYELEGQTVKTFAEEFDFDYYAKLAESDKVVGIGEVGLDYYRLPNGETKDSVKEKQFSVLEDIVRLARYVSKPLVFHIRPSQGSFDAYDDIADFIHRNDIKNFLLHSYLGNLEQAKRFVDLGAMFSFNGILSFKNAEDLREVAKFLPLENILLETDSPYLAPVPFRGKRCEPLYVKYVAEKLAEIKGITFAEVAEKTYNNSKKFFNL